MLEREIWREFQSRMRYEKNARHTRGEPEPRLRQSYYGVECMLFKRSKRMESTYVPLFWNTPRKLSGLGGHYLSNDHEYHPEKIAEYCHWVWALLDSKRDMLLTRSLQGRAGSFTTSGIVKGVALGASCAAIPGRFARWALCFLVLRGIELSSPLIWSSQ